MAMLSVDEAVAVILNGAEPLGAESVGLDGLAGRIAAAHVKAQLTQPPFSASAMDGYAVRFEDAKPGACLAVIGEAPAGAIFEGAVGKGETVRIFTGGVVPDGADHVVIQEEVTRDGDAIAINARQEKPRNIRAAGGDFKKGDTLVTAGETLHEIDGAILAAANVAELQVFRRPVLALFSNGDELVEPGATVGAGKIINSNHYALCAMIERWGGKAAYLGCAPDDEKAIAGFFEKAKRADIAVPVGGASVGDYDCVKSAFACAGGELGFEKVAVKPGKPTWFGRLGATRVVGLPGNPASAIVTLALFIRPLLRRLAGGEAGKAPTVNGVLARPLAANGAREAYLRAKVRQDGGVWRATPAADQDSSLLSPFRTANALIKRPVHAPAAAVGDAVELVWLR